jgi:hypothetical protein
LNAAKNAAACSFLQRRRHPFDAHGALRALQVMASAFFTELFLIIFPFPSLTLLPAAKVCFM